jgi:hypothetical protein
MLERVKGWIGSPQKRAMISLIITVGILICGGPRGLSDEWTLASFVFATLASIYNTVMWISRARREKRELDAMESARRQGFYD